MLQCIDWAASNGMHPKATSSCRIGEGNCTMRPHTWLHSCFSSKALSHGHPVQLTFLSFTATQHGHVSHLSVTSARLVPPLSGSSRCIMAWNTLAGAFWRPVASYTALCAGCRRSRHLTQHLCLVHAAPVRRLLLCQTCTGMHMYMSVNMCMNVWEHAIAMCQI